MSISHTYSSDGSSRRIEHVLRLGSSLVAVFPLTQSGPLIFPASEILKSIAWLSETAEGTGRLLLAVKELLKDPMPVKPPFDIWAKA